MVLHFKKNHKMSLSPSRQCRGSEGGLWAEPDDPAQSYIVTDVSAQVGRPPGPSVALSSESAMNSVRLQVHINKPVQSVTILSGSPLPAD